MLVAAIYLGTGTLWPDNPRPSVRGSVVEWGGRSFTTRRGFEMWLEANGGDYRRWSKNHPRAAGRLSRSPRARRAVMRSAASRRPPDPAGPTERQAHVLLFGFAAGALAFFAIAIVRRIPRPSVPALALDGYGGNGGRSVSWSFPSVPRLRGPRPQGPRLRGRLRGPRLRRFIPQAGPRSEARRSRRLPVRIRLEKRLPAMRRITSPHHRSDGFELAFGIVSVALGLIVGILIPILLT